MKVNNPERERKTQSICLPSSMLMNLHLGERAALRSTMIKYESLHKKFPNWVTSINPNTTQIPNPFFRDEETQFDLATQGEPRKIRQNP